MRFGRATSRELIASTRDLSPMRMPGTRLAPSTVSRTNDLPWIAVVRYGAPRHTRRRTESEIADYAGHPRRRDVSAEVVMFLPWAKVPLILHRENLDTPDLLRGF